MLYTGGTTGTVQSPVAYYTEDNWTVTSRQSPVASRQSPVAYYTGNNCSSPCAHSHGLAFKCPVGQAAVYGLSFQARRELVRSIRGPAIAGHQKIIDF